MSKFKKSFLVIACIIASLAFIFLILVSCLHLFARNKINYDADDALFISSINGNTALYAYDNGEAVRVATLDSGGAWKIRYSLDEISPYLKDGFIAVEDREFYSHNGVNYKRTAKALVNYIFRSSNVFGASTITQQVVKNISGDNEISASRKIAEILRATNIEKNHSKEKILETYLNIVPMTDNMAGVGIASLTYFGKLPSDVTLPEAATIIGITNSPAKFDPYKYPEACIKRRNTVLYAMRDCGIISEAEYNTAKESELVLQPQKNNSKSYDSWFTETVVEDLIRDLSDHLNISRRAAELMVYGGGLSVYTTMNIEIQMILEDYFQNPDNFPDEIENGLNYSMVVCDSVNGNLLGIVGGVGVKNADRILNYATTEITPGSTLKPIALYAPLINERKINWATVFDDVPVLFKDNNVEYPHNSPDVYDGLTTVSTALTKSKNTVAIRLYNILGAEEIYSNLKNNYRFKKLVRNVYDENGNKISDLGMAPLALGQLSYGVDLRTLTEAYTVFPSEGILNASRSYTEVYDSNGKLLIDNKNESKRILTKECSRIMNQLLMNVTDIGTARTITLKNYVDTAGKTGTSGGDRDRLFVGYTPYVTSGIWCGYGNSKPVQKLNPSHLQIWDDVMIKIHEKILKNNETPKSFSTNNLRYLPYCKDSGKNICEKCLYDIRGDREEFGFFEENNKPCGTCDRHVLIPYDLSGNGVANDICPEECIVLISMLDIPERSFPKEIFITDAEYVWRSTENNYYSKLSDEPFFAPYLSPDEYAGKSKKDKQFNSSCTIHLE